MKYELIKLDSNDNLWHFGIEFVVACKNTQEFNAGFSNEADAIRYLEMMNVKSSRSNSKRHGDFGSGRN